MNEPGPRVLVVDDDQGIRRFLEIALRTRGYSVFEAATAQDALTAASVTRPDVVILDLGLPDADGIEVAKRLREAHRLCILVLSVRDQQEEKVAALEAGADDYLTKPFGVEELHARLRVLLRRMAASRPGDPFRIGALEVDLTRREVKSSGQAVRLTPTEYDILKALVQAHSKVLTRQQLLRQVLDGGYEIGSHHLLRVHISNLRRKLEPDPTRPSYILTAPRIGYRLRIAQDEQDEAG